MIFVFRKAMQMAIDLPMIAKSYYGRDGRPIPMCIDFPVYERLGISL